MMPVCPLPTPSGSCGFLARKGTQLLGAARQHSWTRSKFTLHFLTPQGPGAEESFTASPTVSQQPGLYIHHRGSHTESATGLAGNRSGVVFQARRLQCDLCFQEEAESPSTQAPSQQ